MARGLWPGRPRPGPSPVLCSVNVCGAPVNVCVAGEIDVAGWKALLDTVSSAGPWPASVKLPAFGPGEARCERDPQWRTPTGREVRRAARCPATWRTETRPKIVPSAYAAVSRVGDRHHARRGRRRADPGGEGQRRLGDAQVAPRPRDRRAGQRRAVRPDRQRRRPRSRRGWRANAAITVHVCPCVRLVPAAHVPPVTVNCAVLAAVNPIDWTVSASVPGARHRVGASDSLAGPPRRRSGGCRRRTRSPE